MGVPGLVASKVLGVLFEDFFAEAVVIAVLLVGGALLYAGRPDSSADDLLLRAEHVPNQPGIFFWGPEQASVPFGNGTLCIAGRIGRLDVVGANRRGHFAFACH